MTKSKLIKEIKRRIPKGRKVYLEGNLLTSEYYYLWWYVHNEGGVLWIEYECEGRHYCSHGRVEQQAADFDEQELESVLKSMTAHTI